MDLREYVRDTIAEIGFGSNVKLDVSPIAKTYWDSVSDTLSNRKRKTHGTQISYSRRHIKGALENISRYSAQQFDGYLALIGDSRTGDKPIGVIYKWAKEQNNAPLIMYSSAIRQFMSNVEDLGEINLSTLEQIAPLASGLPIKKALKAVAKNFYEAMHVVVANDKDILDKNLLILMGISKKIKVAIK